MTPRQIVSVFLAAMFCGFSCQSESESASLERGAKGLIGTLPYYYLRCNSTDWQPSAQTRLLPGANGSQYRLTFDVDPNDTGESWVIPGGDQCELMSTDAENGWGTQQGYFVVGSGSDVSIGDLQSVSDASSGYTFHVGFSNYGEYTAVLNTSDETFVIVEGDGSDVDTDISVDEIPTEFNMLVLAFQPEIEVDDQGTTEFAHVKLNWLDPVEQAEQFAEIMKRRTGGKVILNTDRHLIVNGFEPAVAGTTQWTKQNFRSMYDFADNECNSLITVDFNRLLEENGVTDNSGNFNNIKEMIDAGDVDFIVVMPTGCANFGEVHMIGPNAHYANGSAIVDMNMTRTATMVTAGTLSWQNVAFLMESFNHYTATRLNHLKAGLGDGAAWPETREVTLYDVSMLRTRQQVVKQVDDFELFKVGDGNNWNEINHNWQPHFLVSPGHGQIGSEHYPVAGIMDYGFGDNRYNTDFIHRTWAVSGQWQLNDVNGHVIADAGSERLLMVSDAAIDPVSNPYPSSDDLKRQEGALLHSSDFDAEFSLRLDNPQTGSHAGILFRVNDFDIMAGSASGYYLALDTEADKVRLIRQTPAASDVIAEAAVVLNSGTSYNIGIAAMGDTITASIDSRKVIEVEDSTWGYGVFGYASTKGNADFSPLVITPRPMAYAHTWYNYPNLEGESRRIDNRAWSGDQYWMSVSAHGGFQAFWIEHLPKYQGVQASGIPNNWWPYMFDPTRFNGAPLPQDIRCPADDTIAPDVISDLAVSNSGTAMRLNWTEPYDEMGVTRYLVYRNGEFLAEVSRDLFSQSVTFYDRDPILPAEYSVVAQDASGNQSAAATVRENCGDVNMDGDVTIVDAVIIDGYVTNGTGLATYDERKIADTNRDGKISRHDARFISSRFVNLIPTACASRKVGDVTGDGLISQADIDAVDLYLNGVGTLSPIERIVADVNDDAQVTDVDLLAIRGYVLNGVPFSYANRPL